MLQHAVATHPYLLANLLWLAALLLAVRMIPEASHRRPILRQGLLMMAFFPFTAFSDGENWSPLRNGGSFLGVEDALCGFNMGATTGLAALLPFRDRLILSERPAPRLSRLVLKARSRGAVPAAGAHRARQSSAAASGSPTQPSNIRQNAALQVS